MHDLELGNIDRITLADDICDLWSAMREFTIEAGFDHTVYATNRLRHTGRLGERAHSFLLTDLPESFVRVFWEQEAYQLLQAVRWAADNTGAISLREASATGDPDGATDAQRTAHLAMVKQGITSGYVIGFNRPEDTNIAGLGFINRGKDHDASDRLWSKAGHVLQSYARVFQLKMASLPLPLADRKLTQRQKDVLRWVARGKTTAEVGTILGLSQATIEKHLRQARDNLGASNTTQAVINAQIMTGLFNRHW